MLTTSKNVLIPGHNHLKPPMLQTPHFNYHQNASVYLQARLRCHELLITLLFLSYLQARLRHHELLITLPFLSYLQA